jgi:4-hydroxy-tetrahydrodipicolinate reductase
VRAASQPDASTAGVGHASVRAGEVAGEHTVLFRNASERVEITHRANGRSAYAAGALAAARWACEQAPGLYGMHDVLGLEAPPTG